MIAFTKRDIKFYSKDLTKYVQVKLNQEEYERLLTFLIDLLFEKTSTTTIGDRKIYSIDNALNLITPKDISAEKAKEYFKEMLEKEFLSTEDLQNEGNTADK